MTGEELKFKNKWFGILIAYFLIGYYLCSFINMTHTHFYDVSLPFESSIPFLPIFILGYMFVFIAIVLIYIGLDDPSLFIRARKFFLAVMTVHFIIFLLVPVRMTRPDLSEATGVMNFLTYLYYLIDNPVNCFPSLHVSFPLGGALILWNHNKKIAYWIALLTAIVAISVVLVKQHYIMDVVGAIVVTGLVYKILKRRS